MTAREIIEARLGHNLPPTKEIATDDRTAIKMLAIRLAKINRRR